MEHLVMEISTKITSTLYVDSFRYSIPFNTQERWNLFLLCPIKRQNEINESREATDPKLDSRGVSGNGGSRAVVPQQQSN